MDTLVLQSGSIKQSPVHKSSSSNLLKDLCLISKQGSLSELDSALSLLKKTGGSVNQRNAFGLTPLHIATWRNHVPIVKRLLAAGADPDARDGESGWSSLHRALHFGHLAVASALLQFGASLLLEDPKCRTPVDLVSGPVAQVVGEEIDSVVTEVFSWGSGTNYQLGTGNAHIQKLPGKVETLQDSQISIIAASKFHSVSVGAKGELYTWGFGRGGRLGHPDYDIHSGQAAVITPRCVTVGLGSRRVKAVAAAKHHTVIATEGGEVFSWGSNREGQLGYTSVDTQPTPRRVGSLKVKIIAVAAANKHTAVVAEYGEVFTWGCNKEGQLGYGTSNSASNYTPRLVEYLKGKVFVGVSAAKFHTIVLGADGEVYTWGHRVVTPRRVVIARSLKKSGSAPLKFHRAERLHVISVAAGVTHSTALSDDGSLFYWISSDPDLRCQQLYSLCGRNVISISAGKYWIAAATATGDVYMWDAKRHKHEIPSPTRLHGVKHATSVCVGETHMLVLCALYHPGYSVKSVRSNKKPVLEEDGDVEVLDEGFMFFDDHTNESSSTINDDEIGTKLVPSLKSMCEKVAAECLVEPRNVIQFLEVADSLEANDLRSYCEEMAIRNLDYILTVSASCIANASPDVLVKLEKALDTKSSEPWSHRCLPTTTATFPAVINSDEERDDGLGYSRPLDNHKRSVLKHSGEPKTDCFLQTDFDANQVALKQVRALRKKLQQIDMLEARQHDGHLLDDQQIAKVQTRFALESELSELGFPLEKEPGQTFPVLSSGKLNKKEASRKQRRKSKKNAYCCDTVTVTFQDFVGDDPVKEKSDLEILKSSIEKEEVDANINSEVATTGSLCGPKDSPLHNGNSYKKPQINTSKKKNRKGGLSMFLSGALDDTPQKNPPPPTPRSERPAWGGAKVTKSLASLRDIQNEQSKVRNATSNGPKDQCGDTYNPADSGQIQLGSFLSRSSPIEVAPSKSVPALEGEKSTPPWSTSPASYRPSLRDIQMQQEKKQQSLSHSPKTRTSGFALPSHSSPAEAGCSKDSASNRWYKPESDAPSSIRSIQIEEKAIKDLKRFYSSVKLVKSEPRTS